VLPRVPGVIRKDEGIPLDTTGHFVTKVDSAQSGGAYFIFRATVEPRRGVLLHKHVGQDEIFYVVEGKFRVQVNGDVYTLTAGDLGNFTKPALHAFHNIGDVPATAVLTVIPGGLENFFRQVDPSKRGTPEYIALENKYGMLEIGNDYIVNSVEMPIVKVPNGEFLMGTPDGVPSSAWSDIFSFLPGDDEKPQHKVKLTRRFGIGKYPVTVGQFKKFIDYSGYKTTAETNGLGAIGLSLETGQVHLDPKFTWRNPWDAGAEAICQTDNHPVISVSYDDAVAFCDWLTARESAGPKKKKYRLPTEAEWEYACRAGSTTTYFFGDDVTGLQQYANVGDQALQKVWSAKVPLPGMPPVGTPLPPYALQWNDGWPFTAIVGRFQGNNWGIYDMAGNVGEWCSDWYTPDYYSQSDYEDPQGPKETIIDVSFVPALPDALPKKRSLRVIRGGNWLDPFVAYRSADRRTHVRHPVDCAADIGFRIVLEWNDEDWDPFEPEKA
jgi:formylglycine-generating enzyme required for sulfatase activity/mannose-6-phosphate isomerase-like protein (cupin superfamily)